MHFHTMVLAGNGIPRELCPTMQLQWREQLAQLSQQRTPVTVEMLVSASIEGLAAMFLDALEFDNREGRKVL